MVMAMLCDASRFSELGGGAPEAAVIAGAGPEAQPGGRKLRKGPRGASRRSRCLLEDGQSVWFIFCGHPLHTAEQTLKRQPGSGNSPAKWLC